MKSELLVGYAKNDITPALGIDISGYFVVRLAEGVLDPLEACAVAITKGDKTALMITLDLCYTQTNYTTDVRQAVSEKTGVAPEAIYIHSTHTHTGPVTTTRDLDSMSAQRQDLVLSYRDTLKEKIIEVCVAALEDRRPAKMGIGVGKAENVAFVRRFRMKDGSAKTNPGVNNPEILHPIGDVDERVNLVRFDRVGAESIALVNFANHPDVVGGCKLSGDWPAFTRRFTERAIENTKCIFFNGAQGDVNHVNVHPKAGDFNDMFNDFDGCSRGYGHARHIGRVVTGAVMQIWDKVEYIDEGELRFMQKVVNIPSNMPHPEDMPLAHKYHELHLAGKDNEIPYEAMMLTTVVAEAGRMVRLEHGPEFFPMIFTAIALGDVVFFGIPGEPFTGIGRGIKSAEGWRMICPTCLTNGSEGYFPMMDSYDEGGYEARSSNFKAGVAEKIVEEGLKILKEIR